MQIYRKTSFERRDGSTCNIRLQIAILHWSIISCKQFSVHRKSSPNMVCCQVDILNSGSNLSSVNSCTSCAPASSSSGSSSSLLSGSACTQINTEMTQMACVPQFMIIFLNVKPCERIHVKCQAL